MCVLVLLFVLSAFAGCAGKDNAEPEETQDTAPAAEELKLPENAGNEELFCLVTSDLHFTLSDIASVFPLGKYTPELARAFAEEAAAREPDVILMCGDNTNSGRPEDAEALVDILEPLHEAGCEVILVTGNHDCAFEGNDFWNYVNRLCTIAERDPDSLSYTVLVDGYRFIAMDDNTAAAEEEGGNYTDRTMEWLKTQLLEAEEMGERAAAYRTVPLSIDRYGTRTLKEALAGEAEASAENLSAIVDAVCGKRYSRAKKERIEELFAIFMSAYSSGTLADRREEIMGSSCYEDFLEAFEESNYGPWIRYMMETAELPGNRAVVELE